jgi:hypothetical protein
VIQNLKWFSIFGNAVQRASSRCDRDSTAFAFSARNRDDNTTNHLSAPLHRQLNILLAMEE